MLGFLKKKDIEKPDFYDLAFLFEANGFTESEANRICDFIDSKDRAPLVVRKTIGRIVNRQEMNMNDMVMIQKTLKHINILEMDFDKIKSPQSAAKIFLKHLLLKSK